MTNNRKIQASEKALKFIGDNPSFDISEFIDRISISDDWAKIVVAHIYLDHIVTEILKDKFENPGNYLEGKGFSEKLALCKAFGYFDDKFGNVLRAINKSRNKFAHKLVFIVSDQEKRDLFRTLTTERPISDVTQPGGFEEFLITVVMFAEVYRAGEKRSAEISKEYNFVSEKILELLIANKNLLDGKI
ncbi:MULTISPECIES: hypothetical protein [unclassified Rhizobium]|uniref:hypothetical protein n=1 Tax=unclassified Rhizobium TaxID=2613769 RepID=UPI000BC92FA3|nr:MULTISPECIES: hypothetical protein [unclassified Rhizobium]MDH7807847.1 hypothetical protein [Rhizobium sp. AN67]MDQ4405719.1 hypothetical protein [Rhizobium sp. AN63]SOD52972.1 hypothetical protein SAMN05216595_1755 [Rhizobium sp. AN6A]